MAKHRDQKNATLPSWVRYSGIVLAAALAVVAFLVLSGIAGQHWQHIAHSLNMSDMPMAPETKP